MNSVKNEQDERNSQRSGFSGHAAGRTPNIFNKQRAMQASQKFSVMSEGGQNFQVKQTGEGIVNRDDGGNLVSADQFAKNLVGPPERQRRKSAKKHERRASANDDAMAPLKLVGGATEDARDSSGKRDVNDTGLLHNLDDVQSPHSPEPKRTSGILVFADRSENKNQAIRPLEIKDKSKDLR